MSSKKILLPVDINEFDVSKITFQKTEPKANRTPTIYLKYGADKKDFQILLDSNEIRLMSLKNKQGEDEYTITQALKGVDKMGMERSEDNTSSAILYNKMLELEEYVIQAAIKNSIEWFGMKRTEEVTRFTFSRIIKCSTDKGSKIPNGKYDPSIRIKVKVYDQKDERGNFVKKIVYLSKAGVKDADGNPVMVVPECIPKIFQNGMQSILAISGKIYTQQGGAFGVTWTLEAAQIFPDKNNEELADSLFKNKKKPTSTAIAEPEEEEEEQETEQEVELTQVEEAPAPAPVVNVPAPVRKKRGPAQA